MDPSSFALGAAIGGGAVLASGFLKKAGEDCYSWVKRKINPKASTENQSHVVIHVNAEASSSTPEGSSTSNPGSFEAERISAVKIDEINEAIASAPPLQRTSVANRFVGIRVEWETEFIGGKPGVNDEIELHLRTLGGGLSPQSVWCSVSTTEYRELGILPEGSRIRIRGEIAEVARWGIYLNRAQLHIHPPSRNA